MTEKPKQSDLGLILVVNPEDDDDYRDKLARQLRSECDDLDGVIQAKLVNLDSVTNGSRAGETIEIGQILLEVLPTFLPTLIVFVQSWMLRDSGRKTVFKLGDTEIEIPAKMSPDETLAYVEKVKKIIEKKT